METTVSQTQLKGEMYVYDGWTALDTTVYNGGRLYLYGGGADSGTVLEGGQLRVSGGYAENFSIQGEALLEEGRLYNLKLSDGGSLEVGAEGSAGSIQVGDGCCMTVTDGIASDACLMQNGVMKTYGSARVEGGTVYGEQSVYEDSVVAGAVVDNGRQYLYDGSMSDKTTVTGGGVQLVHENCSAFSTLLQSSINGAGTQSVAEGGYAVGTMVDGGVQILNGGLAEAASVYGGGSQVVSAGIASDTQVGSQGQMHVKQGGVAQTGAISSGGNAQVSSGGTVEDITVSSGGRISVYAGGVASGIRTESGALPQYIYGTASGTVLNGAFQVIDSGGKAFGTQILSDGIVFVSAGIASNTQVGSKGQLLVRKGGQAQGGSISSGGNAQVSSGGTVKNLTVRAGGRISVYTGGVASGVRTESGALPQYVYGTASGTVLSGAFQVIDSGGKAFSTQINSGGIVFVSAGIASNTQVGRSGQLLVRKGGQALGCSISSGGNVQVSSGGTVKNLTVRAGGRISVYTGGVASGVRTESGALPQYIYGTASGTVLSGAFQVIDSGGKAFGTQINSGGIVFVSAGIASNTQVGRSGQLLVRKGGQALGGSISSGGIGQVSSGGTVKNLTVRAGGKLSVYAGAKVSSLVVSGSGAAVSFAAGIALGGSNTFASCSITGSGITVTSGAKIGMLSSANMAGLKSLSLQNGAALTVAGTGNTLKALSAGSSAAVTLDVSKIGRNSCMLALSQTSSLNCRMSINVARRQKAGQYWLLSKATIANTASFSVKAGSKSLGSVKTGSSVTAYGVKYSLTYAGSQLKLVVTTVAGSCIKGKSSKAETLTGTTAGDVFYGGAGNDSINGKGGRDVVVYDTVNWGKDTILATSGTMDIVFCNGITAANVTSSYNASTKVMTLTRKGYSGQSIVISGWSDETHGIVYGGNMAATSAWCKAVSPTSGQVTSARKEVWTKTGLLA